MRIRDIISLMALTLMSVIFVIGYLTFGILDSHSMSQTIITSVIFFTPATVGLIVIAFMHMQRRPDEEVSNKPTVDDPLMRCENCNYEFRVSQCSPMLLRNPRDLETGTIYWLCPNRDCNEVSIFDPIEVSLKRFKKVLPMPMLLSEEEKRRGR